MSIYSEISPEVRMFADMCEENSKIDPELYVKYDVKRGLRDLNGKGVLTGLTNISEIISSKTVDGKSVPCEGELYYRGYSVEELIRRQPKGTTSASSAPPTCCSSATCRSRSASGTSASFCPSTAPCPPASCGTSS